MFFSEKLGAGSVYLSTQELDFLGDHKKPEDTIYNEICKIKNRKPDTNQSPTNYLNALANNKTFFTSISPSKSETEQKSYIAGRLDRCLVASLVSLIGENQIIIETGTASGETSAFVLHSLVSNNLNNILISIDIPTSKQVTQVHHIKYEEIGACIPRSLRSQLLQIIEDAKTAVPRILGSYNCGLFIHDSLHTPTHMMYEYCTARAFMPPDSIIISDDILWNNSFLTFVKMFDLPFWVCETNPNYGIAVNKVGEFEKNFGWGKIDIHDYLRGMS